MKRILITIGLALTVLGTSAAAGTIALNFGSPLTITTTAAQDAKLARVLAKVNAERATQGQPTLTIETWLRSVLVDALASYAQQSDADEQAEACQAFKQLTSAQQTAAVAPFGGKSPCK